MFIRTRRLFLRPPWPEDIDSIAAAIGRWEIVRNLARAPWPYTRAEAERFVMSGPDADGANFLIFARTEAKPQLVGCIGFGRREAGGEIELGYWIGTEYHGRGYATEAGRAVLHLAFDGLRLPRLYAGHFIDNPASGAVLRKLGFEVVGNLKAWHCAARGRAVDGWGLTLTRERWATRGYDAAAGRRADRRADARAVVAQN